MTLSQTALILILSTQAYTASAGILGCNEEVDVAGQGRQAQIQIRDTSVLPSVEATVGAEEDNAFAPSVFNTVKRYMGIKAPVHNNVASDSASLAVRPSPEGSADSKLAGIASVFSKNISEIADVAVSAGQVTLGKIAPVIGLDLNKPAPKQGGVSVVADVGMRRLGSHEGVSFAGNNQLLNAKLEQEREQERIQQVLAAPSTSIKWEPSASLGLSYRFE